MFFSVIKCRRLVFLTLHFVLLNMAHFQFSAAAENFKNQCETECNIHEESCTKTFSNCTVSLDISPKPVKAMTDLTFMVTLSGKKPIANPYIDLRMPGMHMGPNQVKLKSVGNNVYRGEGIIVRCPSGRRTWKAVVAIPGITTAEFLFDVVY